MARILCTRTGIFFPAVHKIIVRLLHIPNWLIARLFSENRSKPRSSILASMRMKILVCGTTKLMKIRFRNCSRNGGSDTIPIPRLVRWLRSVQPCGGNSANFSSLIWPRFIIGWIQHQIVENGILSLEASISTEKINGTKSRRSYFTQILSGMVFKARDSYTCLCCFRFRISSYYFLFRTIQILKTKSVDKPFATSVLAGVCSMMTFRCFPFTFALIWNTSIWLEWLSWAVQKKNARDEKVINRIQSEVTNTAVSGTSLLGEATMA